VSTKSDQLRSPFQVCFKLHELEMARAANSLVFAPSARGFETDR